jgi:hypothetical protein
MVDNIIKKQNLQWFYNDMNKGHDVLPNEIINELIAAETEPIKKRRQ